MRFNTEARGAGKGMARRTWRLHGVAACGLIAMRAVVALVLLASTIAQAHEEALARCPDQGDMSLQQALEIAEGKRDLPGPLPRLAYALGKDRYPLLELLLARGENPNACIAGGSAMGLLARTGDMEGMRLLREAGAEVDAPRDVLGGTPLLAALNGGSWLSALLLLEWGADARATTDYGFTALHELAIAVTPAGDDQKQLQIEVAIRLADAGSPLDPRNLLGSTPLMYATAARNDSLAAWLVERGADPQAANDRGDTPLALARRRGQSALVELFEQASSRRHGAE